MAVRVRVAEESAADIDSAVNAVIGVVKATGDAVKTGADVVSTGVSIVKQGIDIAAPVVKQGIDIATPYAQEFAKQAAPVVSSALPVVENTLKDATNAVVSSSILSEVQEVAAPVVRTAAEGATAVTPIISSVLLNSTPVLLAEYALAAAALFYLGPSAAGLLFGSLRGYAGTLSAVTTLETLTSDSNAVLIDLRSEEDKEKAGIPDVPGSVSNRCLDVEIASISDKKLRGNLSNPSAIETQITAIQIASLKKVNKGSKVILMDKNGSQSVGVAKELAARGFGKVFVISGGFDGRNGWVQSKLQIKPFAGAVSAIPLGTRIGTARKGLPAPK
jgi:rhodanese-related sulfurtransferase